MLEEIQGYSLVEYLVAFESIILGLIASEYFIGWGEILRNRHKLKISVRHILFTILTAFILFIHWWNIWFRAGLLKDSIFQLLINFPYFILYYLLVYTQFRNFNNSEGTDLKSYYLKNKNKYYLILGLYFFYDQFIPGSGDDSLFGILGIILCVLGIINFNRSIDILILSLGLLLAGLYLILDAMGIMILENTDLAPDHYSKVEHLTIFLSLIYGYVITEYFNGWSRLFHRFKFEWDLIFYSFWTLLCFSLLIEKWWSIWTNPLFTDPNLINYIFLISNSLILYFVTVILLPHELKFDNIPIYEYYVTIKKPFLVLLSIYFAFNLVVDIVLGGHSFFTALNLLRISAIGLSILGIRFENRVIHHSIVSLAMVLLVYSFLVVGGIV